MRPLYFLVAFILTTLFLCTQMPNNNGVLPRTEEMPTISSQSQKQTSITPGTPVTFTVYANGDPVPTFQWQKNDTDISGAISDSFRIATAQVADSGTYIVKVTNSQGSVSDTFHLTVLFTPVITIQPQSRVLLQARA